MDDRRDSKDQIIHELNKQLQDWEIIFNSLKDAAMIVNKDSSIMKANPAMLRLLGKPMDEVIGKPCFEVVHNTKMPVYLCPNEMSKKTKKHQEVELYLADKDMQVEVSVDPCFNEAGNFSQSFHVIRDITRQTKIESEIEEMSSFRNSIIDNAAEGICVCHEIPEFPFTRFMVWNSHMEKLTGYTMEEINRLGWYQAVYPDTKMQEAAKERMSRMRQGDNLVSEEWEITRKDGSKLTLTISTSILKTADDIIHVLAIMNDITERKKTEEALQKSEERIKSIFHIAPIAIGLVDFPSRELKDVNEFLCKMLGYTREELLGKNARMLYLTDADYEFVGREKYRQIKEKGLGVVETRWRKKNGEEVDILLSSTPINTGDLSLGVTFTALDITERKTTENVLMESEERFRRLFESSQDAIIIIDQNEGILDCNPASLKIFNLSNREEMIGKHLSRDFSPSNQPNGKDSLKAREKVIEEALQNKVYSFGWTYQRPDKSLFEAQVILNSLFYKDKEVFQAVIRDITELKKSQAELMKKMNELEKFHKIAVDREIKMIELKKEITALKAQIEKQK